MHTKTFTSKCMKANQLGANAPSLYYRTHCKASRQVAIVCITSSWCCFVTLKLLVLFTNWNTIAEKGHLLLADPWTTPTQSVTPICHVILLSTLNIIMNVVLLGLSTGNDSWTCLSVCLNGLHNLHEAHRENFWPREKTHPIVVCCFHQGVKNSLIWTLLLQILKKLFIKKT